MRKAAQPITALSRFVNIGGIRTHYYDAGDGPVVVLLHSGEFGGCAELSWEYTIDPLSSEFRVVAPDLLGFGQTDKLRDFGSGSDRIVRHLAAFLDVLAIDEADFVGVSMGGTLLLREAAKERSRLPARDIVVAGSGGFVPDNAARQLITNYDGTARSMKQILGVLFFDRSWADDDDYVARRVAVSTSPGAWEALASARLRSPAVQGAIPEFGHADTIAYEAIGNRALVFVGGQDALREPGYHHVFARMPNAKVIVYEDAGHLLNLEKAEDFNSDLLKFLRGRE